MRRLAGARRYGKAIACFPFHRSRPRADIQAVKRVVRDPAAAPILSLEFAEPSRLPTVPAVQTLSFSVVFASLRAGFHGWRIAAAPLTVCLLFAVSLNAYTLPTQTGRRTSFASDDDFLGYVEQQTFAYFWATQHPTTGLVPDRASNLNVSSIAAVGFGLSSTNIAVSRGWITRAAARERVRTTLEFLVHLPQGPAATGTAGYRGWFYHFVDTDTGLRAWNSELSTIDTALLLLGVIDCALFYDGADATEVAIRQVADALVNRVDWSFMLRGDNLVAMDWKPESGYHPSGWAGYNEAMALYVLGLGAANNPLPAASWSAWTATNAWRIHYGYSYVWCTTGSLFTHQYSHCWIDFRGIADAYLRTNGSGIDYFENSRRATLAQQAYAATRPFANYSSLEFGITACDGPGATINGVTYTGYDGRGAPPGRPVTTDDGTLSPTALMGSVPFAPEACVPALRHLYDTYGASIWSDYGYCDAFNITANRWFDPDVIGISAGTNVLMIENHRSAELWQRMLRSPIIQRGLQRAGFTAPPPDNVAAVAQSSTQIAVTWTDRADFETGFQVEASTDGGATFNAVATAPANATSATFVARAGTTYQVRVRTTNASGASGWKNIASVTIPATITITTQPANATVTAGQSASFRIVATGTAPFSYQWFKGSVAIAGATSDTLTFAAAQTSDAGSYYVVVTNNEGSATSDAATLTVNAAPPPAPAPSRGGGGGGAPSLWSVLLCALLALVRTFRGRRVT